MSNDATAYRPLSGEPKMSNEARLYIHIHEQRRVHQSGDANTSC